MPPSNPKRIHLAVDEEDDAIIVSVTFPVRILDVYKTVRVRVSDDDARSLITKLEAILTRRAKRLP